jgi:hypothetical protein
VASFLDLSAVVANEYEKNLVARPYNLHEVQLLGHCIRSSHQFARVSLEILNLVDFEKEQLVVLLDAYLDRMSDNDTLWIEVMKPHWQRMMRDTFADLVKVTIGKKEPSSLNIQMILKGLPVFDSSGDILSDLERMLPETNFTSSLCQQIHSTFPILKLIADDQPELTLRLVICLVRLLRGYLLSSKKYPIDEEAVTTMCHDILELLTQLENQQDLVTYMSEDSTFKHVRNYVEMALKKFLFTSDVALVLHKLVRLIYLYSYDIQSPDVILTAVLEHPKFTEVAHSKDEYVKLRKSLPSLVLYLVQTYPSLCCTPENLSKLVCVYSGTTSFFDQFILLAMRVYESQAGITVLDRILQHWTKESEAGDIFSKIDASKMGRTLSDFNLDMNVGYFDGVDAKTSENEAYDLRFFLPFAFQVVSQPGESLDILSLVRSNLAGMSIMALSSRHEESRKAGGAILSRLESLLRESYMKERNSLVLLLETLSNSIPFEGTSQPRIPTITAAFFAKSLVILTKPESHLYPIINRFLLSRPAIDVEDAPVFYEMLYSSSETTVKERVWVLRLIYDGSGVAEVNWFPVFILRSLIEMHVRTSKFSSDDE